MKAAAALLLTVLLVACGGSADEDACETIGGPAATEREQLPEFERCRL